MSMHFQGNPSKIFKMFFRGNETLGNEQTFFTTSSSGDFGDFGDFFGDGENGGFSRFFTNMGGNGQHPIFKKRMQLSESADKSYLKNNNNSQNITLLLGLYVFDENNPIIRIPIIIGVLDMMVAR